MCAALSEKDETKFKHRVLRDLKWFKNAYYIKTQERGRRGVPDIIGCINTKFFALELKTETGRLDDLQMYTLQKIRLAGGFAMSTQPSQWPEHFDMMKGYFK